MYDSLFCSYYLGEKPMFEKNQLITISTPLEGWKLQKWGNFTLHAFNEVKSVFLFVITIMTNIMIDIGIVLQHQIN